MNGVHGYCKMGLAEEKIEKMAEQLVLAQEALDFLIMGGM